MAGDLSQLLSMRESLTNPDHHNILNRMDGNYTEDFKRRVDSGKIPLNCFSLLKLKSLEGGESKRLGYQPCLILNDAYNVMKI